MQYNNYLTTTDAAEQQGLAVFWHYLSLIFMDIPDHSIVERTRDLLPLIDELRGAFDDDPAGKAVDQLGFFLDECAGRTSEDIDERLNVSYTGLFYLDNPVLMTESAWLSPEGLNMQEQWEEVLEFYKACGFGKPKGYSEPEDHIGLELLFMASLSNSLSQVINSQEEDWREKAESLIETKQRFINKHLGKWSSRFAKAVAAKSVDKPGIYAAGALLVPMMVALEE